MNLTFGDLKYYSYFDIAENIDRRAIREGILAKEVFNSGLNSLDRCVERLLEAMFPRRM